jgi:hypothetical protein
MKVAGTQAVADAKSRSRAVAVTDFLRPPYVPAAQGNPGLLIADTRQFGDAVPDRLLAGHRKA